MDRLLQSGDQNRDDSKTNSDDETKEEGDEIMNGSDDRENKQNEDIEVQEGTEMIEIYENSAEPGTSTAAEASAQAPTLSPDAFGPPLEIPVDDVVRLVNDTDSKSEHVQKITGRVISDQAAVQPDILKKLSERKDVVPHRETIKRWKDSGDADKKLEKVGIETTRLGTWQLQALSKAPSDEIMFQIAREAIDGKLSVRDIRKKISPYVRKAKMEASGALAEMSEQCAEIIEALEDPEKLMQQPKMMILLQDSDRLRTEFTFTELSRIHEKANTAETKIEKQKRALEEKEGKYIPLINFLRLIRKTISAVFEGEKG